MRSLDPNRTGIVAAGLLLAVLSVPLIAQNDDDESDTSPPPAAHHTAARVLVRPNTRGDLKITIYTTGKPGDTDLAVVLRKAIDCDWKGLKSSRDWVEGTCRRYLRSDRGLVDANLDIRPLAVGLAKAGIIQSRFTLFSTGQPQQAKIPWVARNPVVIKSSTERAWYFWSYGETVLPPAFQVQMGQQWQPYRLAAPLLFTLFCPALLALWVRRRMHRQNAGPGSGVVWLNWILLASVLYWLSALRIEDLGGMTADLNLDNAYARMLIGALVFAVPPLLATAACLLALAPQLQPGVRHGSPAAQVLRKTLAAEATFIVPMGLFLVAMTIGEQDWSTSFIGIGLAYGVYRLLAWCSWKWNAQRMISLDSGDLRERTAAIAEAAGAQVKRVYVLENRYPMEVNAFANATGAVSFTRGLLAHLTRREVDAVIAHEVGHLKGKHIGMRTSLYVLYIVVLGPAVGYLMKKAGLPEWLMTLPLAPMIYVFAAGQLSQKTELDADARAVRLTNDPEGAIAALSRISSLTQSPVEYGGIQGSILSHPSMRRRVLSIANQFAVSEPRALELLANPDALGGDRALYPLPAHVERTDPIYTSSARLTHLYWSPWIFGTVLLCLLGGVAALLSHSSDNYYNWYRPLIDVLVFFGSLPLVGWLTLRADDWWDRRFIRGCKRRIQLRVAPEPRATFVSLIPGDRIVPIEGLYAWDLGWISLDPDRLSYRGELASFSVPRSEVTGIEVRKGPLGWCRTYVVALTCTTGNFSLRLADYGRTRRLARKLERQLMAWWRGEAAVPGEIQGETLPPPELPVLHPATPSRLRIAWVFGVRTVLLFLATILLLSASSSLLSTSPMFAFVPFTAPLVYIVVCCPTLIRPPA